MGIADLPIRMRRRIAVVDGCWIWVGYRNADGYGVTRWQGKPVGAHRAAYQAIVGPIRHELDHLCRNRACINPAHLEDVPHRENVLRGGSPSARHARKTHCMRGHEFAPDNIRWTSDGRRQCRTCEAMRGARRDRRKPPRPPKTHCIHGHEYTPENTYIAPNGGGRSCLACRRDAEDRRRRKLAEAKEAGHSTYGRRR